MWQALATELADDGRGGGLDIIAIAIDEIADDVRPWVEGISMPVLIDRDRSFCDLYGVTNVPTVIWIDEAGLIVKPNQPAFGDDTFREFHGVDSSLHHDELRAWVAGNWTPPPPDEIINRRTAPSIDDQLARARFRLGTWLLRHERPEAAAVEFAEATRLAPDDFTIWRASLPLIGDDPFGQTFFDRYEAWKLRTGGEYYPTE